VHWLSSARQRSAPTAGVSSASLVDRVVWRCSSLVGWIQMPGPVS